MQTIKLWPHQIILIATIHHTQTIQICLARMAAAKLAGEIIAHISGLLNEDDE